MTLTTLACLGCGSHYKIAPVSGTLKVNGKTFSNAHITFEPFAQQSKRGPASTGITNAQGNYTLTTIDGDQGAVVGKHRVSIITASSAQASDSVSDEANPKKPKEIFPPKYNTSSELTREVPVEGSDAMDFDLPIP